MTRVSFSFLFPSRYLIANLLIEDEGVRETEGK